MPVVPHQFLFRFTIPVQYFAPARAGSRSFLDLAKPLPLPDFGALDGHVPFAQVRTGWNEEGIGFRVEVPQKKMPIVQDAEEPRESDGFQVWLDTRNTQTVHRANRFCHHFVFVPRLDSGVHATANSLQLPIAMAKEDAPFQNAGRLRAAAEPLPGGGYRLDAWVPAESLNGYDPESYPALGFYYAVRDAELGEQFLTVGREFPFDHDPSLWSTLELVQNSDLKVRPRS